MKKLVTVGLVVLMVSLWQGLSVGAYGDAKRSRLSVELRGYHMDVRGADTHLLDEVLEYDSITGEYGGTVSPKYAEPKNKTVLSLVGSYTLSEKWDLVFSHWGLSTSDSKANLFEAPASTYALVYRNSVFLWGGDYRLPSSRSFWVWNDQHPSGYAPLDWNGKRGLEETSVKLGLSRRLNSTVQVTGGIQWASLKHELSRQVKMTAYVEDYQYVPGLDFKNDITLKESTKSEANNLFPGLYVGMRVEGELGGWIMGAEISQGFIPMEVDLEAKFIDIDDIKLLYYGWLYDSYWWEGEYSMDTSVSKIIPITSISAKIAYPLGGWKLGVGAFYSLWHSVPTPPTLDYRDCTFLTHEKDIAHQGMFISAEKSF